MNKQAELFGADQYLRPCGECRNPCPRTLDFFPEGRCSDGLSTLCRKCAQGKSEAVPAPKPIVLEVRTCEDCGESRSIQQFYMDAKGRGGKSWVCKWCKDRQKKPVSSPETPFLLSFIQDARNQRVRLDVSTDPLALLAQLQEGASVPLRLLATQGFATQAQAEAQQESLMQCFEQQQVYGHWLENSDLLTRWIDGIQPAVPQKVVSRNAIAG